MMKYHIYWENLLGPCVLETKKFVNHMNHLVASMVLASVITDLFAFFLNISL